MSRHAPARTRASAFAAAVAALAVALAPAAPAAAGIGDAKFKVGDRAPDFTLADRTGAKVSLSDSAGREVVLLAFWAMRCGTCISEVPYLEQLHRAYADKGVRLLAVNTDGVGADVLDETLRDIGLQMTYTVLLDPDFEVSDAYTNFVVPLTMVIDRDGVVRYVHTGFEAGVEREYEAALRAALGS